MDVDLRQSRSHQFLIQHLVSDKYLVSMRLVFDKPADRRKAKQLLGITWRNDTRVEEVDCNRRRQTQDYAKYDERDEKFRAATFKRFEWLAGRGHETHKTWSLRLQGQEIDAVFNRLEP